MKNFSTLSAKDHLAKNFLYSKSSLVKPPSKPDSTDLLIFLFFSKVGFRIGRTNLMIRQVSFLQVDKVLQILLFIQNFQQYDSYVSITAHKLCMFALCE